MPSTTALFTGLSGLLTNARQLDVIGNNIANVNSTSFKSNRMLFQPIFSRNMSLGSAPSGNSGGTNPSQIGLGSSIAGTQRNFNNGAITATGVTTDVAIEGDGFFIVNGGAERTYTRNGAFQLNELNDLVNISGGRVMGYAVDDQFEVIEGNLIDLNIPIGTLTLAEATRNVTFNGNVNASGEVATTGSTHEHRAFHTDAGLTTPLAASTFDLTVGGNDLYIDDGAGGSFLAFEGGTDAVVTISGVEKGGKDLGTHSFAFSTDPTVIAGADDSGATIDDFMDFLRDVLGLDNSVVGSNQLGGTVTFNNGVITITGNEGEVQDLDIETGDIVVTSTSATAVNQPFVMTKTGAADGESVRTSLVVFDSLGTPLTVDLTLVLQDTQNGDGTVWEYVAESSDNDALNRVLGLGEIRFDGNGEFVSSTNSSFALTRANGAVSPLTVNMVFDSGTDAITSLTDLQSTLAAIFQDGSPIGTLNGFAIGDDGTIAGSFTNGLTRDIGRIALAKFVNPEGLIDLGGGDYRVGPNSGDPIVTSALEFGAGRMLGGALELSNVDLSQEFINMILASTGYSAASRVITTTDELIDQLLVLGR